MAASLVCIPPVSGSWDCYAAIRAAAPAGLELRALVPGRDFAWTEASTIEELGAAIVEHLDRGEAPHGLLGWSFGGLVAAESAARLHAAGRPLASLVLLDVMFPAELPEVVPRGHIVEMLVAFLAARVGVELDQATRQAIAAEASAGTEALLATLQQAGLMRAAAHAGRLAGLLARYERAIERGNRALIDYGRDQTKFGQPLVDQLLLLRASLAHPASDAWFAADPLAWAAIGRRVAVEAVEGDHYSIIQSAGAATIAAALARHLGPAQA